MDKHFCLASFMTTQKTRPFSQERMDNSIQFGGLSIFSGTKNQLLKAMTSHLDNSRETAYIMTPNAEQFVQANADTQLKEDLQAADLCIPDGIGLVWASRVVSDTPLSERIPGVEIAAELLALVGERNFKVVLVGGRGFTSQELSLYPHLTWVPGYADVTHISPQEEAEVAAQISRVRPRVVLVALGAPHQERWLMAHRELLEKSEVKIAMVVGGAMDVLLGRISRAPVAWQSLGLEWLYRLIRQPWRVWRQLRLLVFVGMVSKMWALKGRN
jgi:N-acetylglucosaminyldiphosphoundecaprenol N-acetyl-beta-D-mannosaminyltransferase